jgi:hypothetical protein
VDKDTADRIGLSKYPEVSQNYWPQSKNPLYRVPITVAGEIEFNGFMDVEDYLSGNLISVPQLLNNGWKVEFGEHGGSFWR